MNQDTNSVKKEIVSTITDQKTFVKSVKVQINYTTLWQKILSAIFIIPRYHKKKIYLSNLWPGTVVRLLGILVDLKANRSMQDVEIYSMIKHNIPLFIDFLATGLHNSETPAPKWLKRALSYQFSNEELEAYTKEVYRRLDVETFFVITGSLINLQNLSHILEAQVPGQSSETSASIMDGPSEMSNGK